MRPARVGYVREAVLDAAAEILLRDREATMAQIADAAGVGRATLYRHYDSRDALIRDLVAHAVSEAADAVEAAHTETVEVREGLARVMRALLSVGHRFQFVLTQFRDGCPPPGLSERVGPVMAALFARGLRDGTLRDDVPVEWLQVMLRHTVKAAMTIVGDAGPEEAAAFAVRQFLDGAAP